MGGSRLRQPQELGKFQLVTSRRESPECSSKQILFFFLFSSSGVICGLQIVWERSFLVKPQPSTLHLVAESHPVSKASSKTALCSPLARTSTKPIFPPGRGREPKAQAANDFLWPLKRSQAAVLTTWRSPAADPHCWGSLRLPDLPC